MKMLVRSPGDVMKEHLRKLYLRLYPAMTDDFSHTDDIKAAFISVQAELDALKLQLQIHTHPVSGAATGPPIVVLTPSAPFGPTSAVGKGLIVPGGVPQPTGSGVAVVASRVAGDIIAMPPIDPTLL